jgi:hypothetical protein
LANVEEKERKMRNNKTVLALILLALTVSAYSQQYDSESDFEVVRGGSGVVIVGYLGSKQEVRVPPSIQNLPVTIIGNSAFTHCTSLTAVTIPDSVTAIGGYAFQDCASLTAVTIPAGVTTIGGAAFPYCTSLTGVTIPASVTIIERGAFAFCSSLTSVTIPASVTIIERGAFMGCESLISVTIPNSVTSIGIYAFYNCTSLTSVTIPNSVTRIGDWAFAECEGLTSVTFQGTIASSNFYNDAFYELGDLRAKFYAANSTNGTPGTYTRASGGQTWTRR